MTPMIYTQILPGKHCVQQRLLDPGLKSKALPPSKGKRNNLQTRLRTSIRVSHGQTGESKEILKAGCGDNPSTGDAKKGGARIQGKPWLHKEFEVSLCYIIAYLKESNALNVYEPWRDKL